MLKTRSFVALLFLLLSSSISLQAQENKITPPSVANIDQYDSVVFDLSQASVANGYVEFPVYFKTDDVIYALDFSLKYNHNKYVFDTIIDLTNYLLDNSYYNPFDSTIRFTSSSLTPIPNLTPLVKVRFDTVLTSLICNGDIYTMKGYLNGDQCSVKLIDCALLSIAETPFNSGSITVFPVPAKEAIHIRMNEMMQQVVISLHDFSGRLIDEQIHQDILAGAITSFNTENLSPGLYLITLKTGNHSFSAKTVICR